MLLPYSVVAIMARKTQNPSIPPKYSPQQGILLLERQLERLEREIISLPHDSPEVTAWEQRTTTLLDDIFGQPNGNKHTNTYEFAVADSGLAMTVTAFGGYEDPNDDQNRHQLRERKRAALLRAYLEQLKDEVALLSSRQE